MAPVSAAARISRTKLAVLALTAVAFGLPACGSNTDSHAASPASPPATTTPPPATTTRPPTTRPPTTPAPTTAPPATTVPRTTPAPATSGSALAGLATLPVKGRAPMTGYSRLQFGPAWTDDVSVADGHNGCDTRNDILRRDLTMVVLKPGTNGCVVATGVLHDPYTGATIHFTRGVTSSEAVQIDHVVALGDAWQTGAQQLNLTVRTNLANDPLELLAVSGPANDQKGDSDAASWLPPNKGFRCSYVARQVAVKMRYRLWVTPAERAAIARVLATCPGQTLPSGGPPSVTPSAPAPRRPCARARPRSSRHGSQTAPDHAAPARLACCEGGAPRGVLLAARSPGSNDCRNGDGVQARQQRAALPVGQGMTPAAIKGFR